MSNVIEDVTIRNLTVVGTCDLPNSSVSNRTLSSSDPIDPEKQKHRYTLTRSQANGVAIEDAEYLIHTVRGTAGTIVAIEVAIETAAIGDSTVTVDLQKGNTSSAFATVLSSPISIDESTAVRTPTSSLPNTASIADGDILKLVVDAAAGTGTLPQGIIITVVINEDPV